MMEIKQPLGATFSFAGFVIEPLWETLNYPTKDLETLYNLKAKQEKCQIYVWHGKDDTHFPYKEAFARYNQILEKWGMTDNLKLEYAEPGLGHSSSLKGF